MKGRIFGGGKEMNKKTKKENSSYLIEYVVSVRLKTPRMPSNKIQDSIKRQIRRRLENYVDYIDIPIGKDLVEEIYPELHEVSWVSTYETSKSFYARFKRNKKEKRKK